MALTFSDAGSAASSSAPSSFSFTPTQASGDVFIVHICLSDSGRTISPPSGWTAAYNSGGPEAGQQAAVFYKQVNGSEPTPFTFSWTGGGSNHASTAMRIHGDAGSVTLEDFTVSTTATDGASPYTTASISVDSHYVVYGIAGEGTAASITWSQAHGDTEIADVTSGSGTGESAACYRSASTLSGSVSRTMTASANDRFAALWWIAEVVESSGASSANAGNSATSSVASTPLARVGAAAGLAR